MQEGTAAKNPRWQKGLTLYPTPLPPNAVDIRSHGKGCPIVASYIVSKINELGFYRVEVEATDGAGQRVFTGDVGTFAYAVRTAVGPQLAQPSTVTYTQRAVRVRGTLTGGAVQSDNVITGPDGSFEVTVEVDGLYASFGGDPGHEPQAKFVEDRGQLPLDGADLASQI